MYLGNKIVFYILTIDNLGNKEQSRLVDLLKERYGGEVGEEAFGGREVPFFVPGMTVYNPSIPFMHQGELIIAGRVEQREEHDSQVMFFRERGGIYFPIESGSVFNLEDPFVTDIQGKIVFGGVSVDHATGVYQTEIYTGVDIDHLELLCLGPAGMKDIRLVDLGERGVGVFTRPQSGKWGRGKIGFGIVSQLGELCDEIMQDMPLLEDQFGSEKWGGVNQAILLADGVTIGVIGHIAEFEVDGAKRYSAMAFEFNTVTGECPPMRIIAKREDFPPTKPKIPELTNVVFASGIVFDRVDYQTMLWVGLGDAAVGNKRIKWPFSMGAK